MADSNLCPTCYHYDPSMPAAIIFTILFFSTSVVHVYQLARTKTWYLIPLMVGGVFEFVGYIGRAVGSSQSPEYTFGPYVLQIVLILIAPALFAASIYMALGRVVLLVDGEAHSLIKKRWLTKLFVAGDVLAFATQATGGARVAAKTAAAIKSGSNIILAGLFIQVFCFGFFVVVAVVFHRAMIRVPTPQAMSGNIPWRKHLYTLYAASAIIMVRSVFRIVEYIQGSDGYILDHEVFLYIFDSVLMLAVMVIFNAVYPGEVQALLRGGRMSQGVLSLQRLDSAPPASDWTMQHGDGSDPSSTKRKDTMAIRMVA